MLMDIAMIVTLIAGFGIVMFFLNWCEKQINR